MDSLINRAFKIIEDKYPKIVFIKSINVERESFLIVDCKINYSSNRKLLDLLIFDIIQTTLNLTKVLFVRHKMFILSHFTHIIFSNKDKRGICLLGEVSMEEPIRGNKNACLIHKRILSQLEDINWEIEPEHLILELTYNYR